MSKKEQVRQRGQYTLEFKLEAVRLVKGVLSADPHSGDVGSELQ
jgi:hypothetical protein